MRRMSLSAIVLFAAQLLPVAGLPQTPEVLSYQGRLLKTDGTPEIGPVLIRFSLFRTATGGTAVWTEEQSVGLKDGFFSAYLGDDSPLGTLSSVLNGSELWLEMSVGGEAMTPRQRLASAPYALTCGKAQHVSGGTVDAASVSVSGQPVVTRVSASPPMTSSEGATPTIGLKTCGNGQILKFNGSAWDCAADLVGASGTVTGVTASAPLASSGGAAPNVSMPQASGTTSGYLSATDWSTFNGRLSSVAVATNAGLSGNGTGGSPLAVSFGGNGSAATASRSDHSHALPSGRVTGGVHLRCSPDSSIRRSCDSWGSGQCSGSTQCLGSGGVRCTAGTLRPISDSVCYVPGETNDEGYCQFFLCIE